MSGASEAVAVLHEAAEAAYRPTYAAGGNFARARSAVSQAADLVEVLARGIDLLVAAEALHAAADGAVRDLRAVLATTMQDVGATQIRGSHHSANLAKKPQFLSIADESLIPREYFVTPPPSLDKRALKSAVKDGFSIEGVNLVTPNEMSLRIVSNKETPT